MTEAHERECYAGLVRRGTTPKVLVNWRVRPAQARNGMRKASQTSYEYDHAAVAFRRTVK